VTSSSYHKHDDRSFSISLDQQKLTNPLTTTSLSFERRQRRRQFPISEARLWMDCLFEENSWSHEEEYHDLIDTQIYSSSSPSLHHDPARMVLPFQSTKAYSIPQVRLPLALESNNNMFDDVANSQKFPSTVSSSKSFNTIDAVVVSHNLETRLQQLVTVMKSKLLKTGTTIAGICGYDTSTGRAFCVLGADTRATAGRMVADKQCQKIHCLARNIWACGAGTSADLDAITRQCRYSLALQSLVELESVGNTGGRQQQQQQQQEASLLSNRRLWRDDEEPDRTSSLESTALHVSTMAATCRYLRNILYEGSGSIGANLIVGGVDPVTGQPHLRAIHPHGSMDPVPYAALGSGGLAAMAVLESRFSSKTLTLEKAVQMVQDAIVAGIQNDMGSGSQVDLCIITTSTTTDSDTQQLQVQSNYTRAVVPEETLIALKSTAPTLQKNAANRATSTSTSSSLSTPGVNGFGSHPFSVRSKRMVFPSRQQEEQERLTKWNQRLGLNSDSASPPRA